MFEGRACPQCGQVVDPTLASTAASERDRYIAAFSHANALVLTARGFLIMFGLCFLPFVRPVGLAGVPALLVWVPASAILWYKRYGAFKYQDPEYKQVRSWVRQSLAIWAAAAIATPFWVWFFFIPKF